MHLSINSFSDSLIGIVTLVFLIIFYKPTKEYSLKYKIKCKKIAIAITILSFVNLILINSVYKNSDPFFVTGLFLGLLINYAILKGELRVAQSVSDINWLTGSSYLKGKFSFKNIDWALIFKTSLILLIWTTLVFGIFKPEMNDNLTRDLLQGSGSKLIAVINNIIVICLIAPLREEIIFRFFGINIFLHWFGKKRKISIALAVLIPTITWMYLHSGTLANNWIKYVQVLPAGLAFSYILYKKDVEHSILTHIVFNITAFFITFIFLKLNFIRI